MATLCEMATPAELRSLYLAISKRVHPDRPGGSIEAMQKENATWSAIKKGDGYEDARSDRERLTDNLRADMYEEFVAIAARWNERLADLNIQTQVTPASAGLFVLTMFDVREDEIGTALDAKIRENEIF
jgi:head-tail adaptor